MKFKENQGFSLIEMMVVVAIMGVLAVVAVPKFQLFKAKAIRSEALGTLTQIHLLQQAYQIDNDTYATSLAAAGYTAPTTGLKYGYVLSGVTAFEFLVTATKTNTAKFLSTCSTAGDVATINQTKTINITTDGLAGC